jgi:pimeloyl-ACP methyl ester carboxylesterase
MSGPTPRPDPFAPEPIAFAGATGWLHGGRGPTVVVVAGSLGFERLTAHRFLRMLAERLAAAGIAVLRFDWRGTGDALGVETDLTLAACRDDLAAAVAAARAATGADRVVVVGLRFGAFLAAEAAAAGDLDGLVLLAPPASGRGFGRELAAMGRLIDAALPAPPAGSVSPDAPGTVTAAGFRYAPGFVASLRDLVWPDLGGVAGGGPRRVLVVAPPTALETAPRLGLGDAVEIAPFTGYERMMCDPTAGEVAVEVLDRLVAWFGPGHDDPPLPPRVAAVTPEVAAAGFREERFRFGPGGRLAGVWCRPDGPSHAAVIFANSGGIPHTGWARMTVDHARGLAAVGVASLRFDFAELGDSAEALADPRDSLYDPAFTADLVAALDCVAARGHAGAAVFGICSGAHHAFHVARRDTRIRGLFLVNILCFEWAASYAVELNLWKHARMTGAALEADGGRLARRAAALLRPLRGLAKRAVRGALALPHLGARLVRLAGGGNPVERAVRALAGRGVFVALVSAEGDRSLVEIARHLGPGAVAVADLPAVTLTTIPASDHTVTPAHARARLAEILRDHLAPPA